MFKIRSLTIKQLSVVGFSLAISACADTSPIQVMQGLFGYTPPPEETTISEELTLEYDRCMKIGKEKNCAQAAYDVVRTVKGLEPRAVPKGVVIILEGDGGHLSSEEESQQDKQNQQDNQQQNDN